MDHADRLNGKSLPVDAPDAIGKTRAGCGVAFMAKASEPGRAKTRLVPPLTFEEAAALNTAFLQDVADNVLAAAKHAGIAGYAAFGPPGSEAFFQRALPPAFGLIEAWLPDFGDCLFHAIERILARGHGGAVVLNADSPTLPTEFLVETAEVLARPGDRAVLGPSSDGGYYLLGLKTAHRHMFHDIAWSTERVAARTLERAHEIGLDMHRLPVWYDVDDVDDLTRLYVDLDGAATRRPLDHDAPHRGSHTAAFLNRLWHDRDFHHRAAGFLGAELLRV